MTYKTSFWCVSCHEELFYEQRFYNHGTCPLCGFRGIHAGTIVDTYTRSYRVVTVPSGKWWKRSTRYREYIEPLRNASTGETNAKS